MQKSIIQWLEQKPLLPEVRAAYPHEWKAVQDSLADIMQQGDIQQLQNYVITHFKTPKNPSKQAHIILMLRKYIAELIIRDYCLSAATGVTTGKIRFNKFNGYIIQRLCFVKGLERKPISLFWFKLFWPLLSQRNYLMPLVEPKGIYCFYSNTLIRELATLIGSKTCLEIAAGDGTLSRFLKDARVKITPTDDYSWNKKIKFPKNVINLDGKKALKQYNPEVVICSWPPTNNNFEAEVFATKSVQVYIVIGSQSKLACGNWQAYENQTAFDMRVNAKLSHLVLPPELGSSVTVFTRIN